MLVNERLIEKGIRKISNLYKLEKLKNESRKPVSINDMIKSILITPDPLSLIKNPDSNKTNNSKTILKEVCLEIENILLNPLELLYKFFNLSIIKTTVTANNKEQTNESKTIVLLDGYAFLSETVAGVII